MVIDTSALLCILLGEPEAEQCARLLVTADSTNVIASVTWFEAMLVITSRRGEAGHQSLTHLLDLAHVEILPVDTDLAQIAYQVWLRYGKGRHPAGLNFGDCFSYALAKQREEPLLFKGEDFSKTDVLTAI